MTDEAKALVAELRLNDSEIYLLFRTARAALAGDSHDQF